MRGRPGEAANKIGGTFDLEKSWAGDKPSLSHQKFTPVHAMVTWIR